MKPWLSTELKFMEDNPCLSAREMAEILGRSLDSVKSKLYQENFKFRHEHKYPPKVESFGQEFNEVIQRRWE